MAPLLSETLLMRSGGGFPVPGPLRDFVLPALALLAGLTVPSPWVVYTFVVIGQGHFMMSLLYQHRAGKMNRRYLALAALLAVGAYAYVYFLGEKQLWMLLAVALLFSGHFAFDEATLHAERISVRAGVTMSVFTLLSFSILLNEAFPQGLAFLFLQVLAVVFFSGAVVRILVSRTSISRTERYLWYVGGVMVLLYLLGRPEQALSLLIIIHCLNWAIAYAERVKGNDAESKRYWNLTFLTNATSLGMFVAYFGFNIEYLRYFFLLLYYDAWAIAHVVLSFVSRKRVAR